MNKDHFRFWPRQQGRSDEQAAQLHHVKTDWQAISDEIAVARAQGERMERLQVERMFAAVEERANTAQIKMNYSQYRRRTS